MSTVPAGWYPDPGNTQQQRWWDSVQWGPQTRPLFQAPPPPPPPPGMPYPAAPYYSAAAQPATGATTTRLRKTNGIGFAGAVVGLGSFIIDPFILTSATGIVLCIIGLANDEKRRNAGAEVAGRGWIIAGLILSCVSAILYGAILLQGLIRDFAN